MEDIFTRLTPLFGEKGIKKLKNSHVAVFGLGGVGGICTDSLARCGVGEITVVDNDVVSPSNLNRQLIALNSSLGQKKTQLMQERLMDVNPSIKVHVFDMLYLPSTSDRVDFSKFDYVIDAVDNVTAKLDLVSKAMESNIPIISCMGTAFRLNPSLLRVSDIFSTSDCSLCRVMRRELRKRNIPSLKVVYSTEAVTVPMNEPASAVFVPSAAGLLLAKTVVEALIKESD